MPTSTTKNGSSLAKATKPDKSEKAEPAEEAAEEAVGDKAAKPEKHEVRRPGAGLKTEDKQPITVLFDRVMVQISQTDGERRSRAGILIPATAQITRRLTWAEAVAVGPHVRTVKVGDTVLFNPEDRFEVEVHGEEYVILRERDIHAIASPRNDSGTGLYL
ncbi:MAG TPA: co-chaperone GroES [Acidimicrobiales bacterium]|nr:co-chaperone GroES [Acidimicrobiales bacterium]